jgi:photosystem II stability/assembly factor-like uncharacterized protein
MGNQVTLLVGTNKGAFVFRSDSKRAPWVQEGPHLSGWSVDTLLAVPALAIATAEQSGNAPVSGASLTGMRFVAGTSHLAYGPTVRVSDDGGETWSQQAGSPRFAKESGQLMRRVWEIVAAPHASVMGADAGAGRGGGTLYAGVEDVGLFTSEDSGATWHEVTSVPGARGFVHSVVMHPGNPHRLWLGVQGLGVFRSEDGGTTWCRADAGLPAAKRRDQRWQSGQMRVQQRGQAREQVQSLAPSLAQVSGQSEVRDAERESIVHRLAGDPTQPERLYVQHHQGVFRSDNGGENWYPITAGLPGSGFGFPLCVAPNGDVLVVPLESEDERYMPEGSLAVYRSRDGGEHWEKMCHGLPETPQFVSVLRGALTTDTLEPYGVYFGTTAGELFCSADAGETWRQLPGQFSRITTLSVSGS